jgi:hypothetical protein
VRKRLRLSEIRRSRQTAEEHTREVAQREEHRELDQVFPRLHAISGHYDDADLDHRNSPPGRGQPSDQSPQDEQEQDPPVGARCRR